MYDLVNKANYIWNSTTYYCIYLQSVGVLFHIYFNVSLKYVILYNFPKLRVCNLDTKKLDVEFYSKIFLIVDCNPES